MKNEIFLKHSIPELVQSIKRGEFSSDELLKISAQVINEKESTLHAWVCYDPYQSKKDSVQIFKRRNQSQLNIELDGIPFGVKDIFNTKSFPTQMGSSIWKNFTPGNNARVVDSLIGAGGLVVGKTVTAEFAVHALNETLNPHDPIRTPGTSSSGSAAAVATGMVPFALGSQTAGSIIRPASFCGVWGMKPSFGMIPRTGVLKTTDSLDTIGFLASHAKSLRVILDNIRVKGPNYPFVFKNIDISGIQPKPKGQPWRVGFVKTHTWNTAEKYAQVAITDLTEKIAKKSGFEVEELEWPTVLLESHLVHSTIYTKSLAYYFQNEATHSLEISPIMSSMILEGKGISSEEFQFALRQQEVIADVLDQLLRPYDFVISLGTSSSAPLRGEEELPDPSLIWTLGHIPSVAAPTFRCPIGLPFGAQFISKRWGDYRLLQAIENLVDSEILPSGSQPIIS